MHRDLWDTLYYICMFSSQKVPPPTPSTSKTTRPREIIKARLNLAEKRKKGKKSYTKDNILSHENSMSINDDLSMSIFPNAIK